MIDSAISLYEQGFRSWLQYYPPDVLIEIAREGDAATRVCHRKDLPPEIHIGGLFWRLTGIGWEELGWDWRPVNTLNSLFGNAGLGASMLSQQIRDDWWKI